MAIKYYVDADLIGLGKLLVQVRTDVTYAGDEGGLGIDKKPRDRSPIAPGALDPVWIPEAAGRNWLVITKDTHMAGRPEERRMILTTNARHLRIAGTPGKKLRKWDQLEIVVSQWRTIERLFDEEPGPWIRVLTRTGLRTELDASMVP